MSDGDMSDGIPPGSICEIATGRNAGRQVKIVDWARRMPRLNVMTGEIVSEYCQLVDPIDELDGGPCHANAKAGFHVAILLCSLKPLEV